MFVLNIFSNYEMNNSCSIKTPLINSLILHCKYDAILILHISYRIYDAILILHISYRIYDAILILQNKLYAKSKICVIKNTYYKATIPLI